MKHSSMIKEVVHSQLENPTARVTRARARVLGQSGGLPPLHPTTIQDGKRPVRTSLKSAASNENKSTNRKAMTCFQKKRTALADVTNVISGTLDGKRPVPTSLKSAASTENKSTNRKAMTCFQKKKTVLADVTNVISGTQDVKRPVRTSLNRAASNENKSTNHNALTCLPKKRTALEDVTNVSSGIQDKKITLKRSAEVGLGVLQENPLANKKDVVDQTDIKKQKTEKESSLSEMSAAPISFKPPSLNSVTKLCAPDLLRLKHNCSKNVESLTLSKHGENRFYKEKGFSDGVGILDIDSKHNDPLMCTTYAPIIYEYMKSMEIDQRPSTDYMESIQQHITQSMRGILVDWLVEVSAEYMLAPDTLYLAVNLTDRFLSGNCLEKQKLQLLGVTCMLIASKYEEICAPRVEDFCFITDNTYTKAEVVEMECRVLNFLNFRVSVPTTKKFLRRFIQAGQASLFKVASLEFELLANYLADLTLVEYSFLKFLPSLIAASAVFLAKWTLDQSCHPWNPTLECYTNYKATELKTTVLALQEIQLNTNGCKLNAIRSKYKQEKFKCVANLSSSKPVQSLF